MKLPTDFAIFSPPMVTMPRASSGARTGGPPPSAWARSFSWCGNTRSLPPPWRSNPSPRMSSDIAEHSMCQPGRPLPHGESHAGSPGLAAFQSAKSIGLRLARRPRPARPPTRAARRACGAAARRSRGTTRRRSTRPGPRPRTRGRGRSSSPMSSTISAMYSVACGHVSGARTPSAVELLEVLRSYVRREVRLVVPRSAARR